MKAPTLRKAYDDHEELSLATGLKCEDPSKTVQSFKDDADINIIVKHFGLGEVPLQNRKAPITGDFTGVMDYQSALNAIINAEDTFMALPAQVRERFGNNPGSFIAFCDDENNIEELRKLGLAHPKAEPPKPPEPMLVRIAPEEPKK